MKSLLYRVRWWFLDTFGDRYTWKTDRGHGNYDQCDGWMFRGNFYACDPRDQP